MPGAHLFGHGVVSFTPAASGSYLASRPSFGPLAVYTGTSLAALNQVTCGSYQAIFHADAGTTYYLQVASDGYAGSGQLSVDRAPDPQASFYFWPTDPSIFDTVWFSDYSYDFAGIGSRRWRLGDGFMSTAAAFGHRFVTDGSYSAKLDIRTTDGRTGSQTQTVAVTTHDVAIVSMTVPRRRVSARPSRSRSASTTAAIPRRCGCRSSAACRAAASRRSAR